MIAIIGRLAVILITTVAKNASKELREFIHPAVKSQSLQPRLFVFVSD